MAQALNPNRAGVQVLSDNNPDGSRQGSEKNIFTGRNQLGKGANIVGAFSITLGQDGNYFELTGTTETAILSLDGWQDGSIVTIHVPNGMTMNLSDSNIQGVTNSFSPTTSFGGNLVIIKHSSILWHELSRADLAG